MTSHFNPDHPLIHCTNPIKDTWIVLWNEVKGEFNEELEQYYLSSFSFEEFDHKPTIAEVKETIISWYNEQINSDIQGNFTWNNMPVWLSIENQLNYKTAYDLATYTSGKILPTFKFGTSENPIYYTFEDLDTLKDFYTQMASFVAETLSKGWKEKDSIDWTIYEELLK